MLIFLEEHIKTYINLNISKFLWKNKRKEVKKKLYFISQLDLFAPVCQLDLAT